MHQAQVSAPHQVEHQRHAAQTGKRLQHRGFELAGVADHHRVMGRQPEITLAQGRIGKEQTRQGAELLPPPGDPTLVLHTAPAVLVTLDDRDADGTQTPPPAPHFPTLLSWRHGEVIMEKMPIPSSGTQKPKWVRVAAHVGV